MKKLFYSLLIFSSLFFISCIDIVESISLKDDNYVIDYKVTFSKTMLELANSFSGSNNELDFDSIYNELLNSLPSEAAVQKIDTDIESGIQLVMNINKNEASEDVTGLLPEQKNTLYRIPLIYDNENYSEKSDMDKESEYLTNAVLSAAKYRFIISKKIIPYAACAYFEAETRIFFKVYDYEEVYCIEIPFIYLMNASKKLYLFVETDKNAERGVSKSEYSKETFKYEPKEPVLGKGPFGLDMGMNYDQVSSACDFNSPEYISGDKYSITPLKTHPLFENYSAFISKTYGLYCIRAESKKIKTNDYGTEVKQEFEKLLTALEKKYGKFKKTDRLNSDRFNRDEYWMYNLLKGSQIYEANWSVSPADSDKYNGLISINMGIKPWDKYSYNEAFIWIEYCFKNQDSGRTELEDAL